jgi:hypothetical protein
MMPTRDTRLINASKTKTLALDDVWGHDGDVQGPQGPTSMWKSKVPLGLGLSGGLGLPGCLQRKRPFSRCKSSISSYPWLGLQHPSVGSVIPDI